MPAYVHTLKGSMWAGLLLNLWEIHSRWSWTFPCFSFPFFLWSFVYVYILTPHEKFPEATSPFLSSLPSSLLQYTGLWYKLGKTGVHISFLPQWSFFLEDWQESRRKISSILAIKASQCLESRTCFNKGLLGDYFLSSIFRKSNQNYYQRAATRLVTLHFTFQSHGAQVSLNHWKHGGWRELAQILEAAASLGLLISLLPHQSSGQKWLLHWLLCWKSRFGVIWSEEVGVVLPSPLTVSISISQRTKKGYFKTLSLQLSADDKLHYKKCWHHL